MPHDAVAHDALGIKHAAMEQYRSLPEETPPGTIQDLLRFPVRDDPTASTEPQARCRELVYPGNV